MTTEPGHIEQQPSTASSGFASGLARIFWTVLGPLLLLGALAHNVANAKGWFSIGDALVGLVVAVMIACRWQEQRSGEATTAYGEPSTPEHFRRYVLVLMVAAGVAWVLANVLGNHVLSR